MSQKSVNAIKVLGVDAINKAKSGHPGIVMGAAPMAYSLFTKHLRVNPKKTDWINRDRFVLSAGHGSMLLYSLLHLSGFEDVSLEEVKNFRQWGSKTPGHPEFGHTKGIDATTGPLGQGISTAVGMALAERYLAAKYNKEGYNLFDHYTYVICGDGDIMEGVASEASSFAAVQKLNKLVVLYDSNDICLDGETKDAFSENVRARYEAYGWNTILVQDGANVEAVNAALEQAKKSDKPTLIEVKTIIGAGSPNRQGTNGVHGAPLGNEETALFRKEIGWENEPFDIPADVYADFKANVADRGEEEYAKWDKLYADYKVKFPELAKELEEALTREDIKHLSKESFSFKNVGDAQATRNSSQDALNSIAAVLPTFFGGSADLSHSNMTFIKGDSLQDDTHRTERNVQFGVREFAMATVLNGLMLHGGVRVFGGTFFVFSDYLKGALRLSALQNLPVTYVFTHDSIAVGEDGPTHEPIEHLASLRTIPNTYVFRPADATETQAAWYLSQKTNNRPTSIVLTRQNLPILENSSFEKVSKGAYVVYETAVDFDTILIATGSEVALAIDVARELEKDGFKVRVVSMPSVELFEEQSKEYKEELLPLNIRRRVSLEMGNSSLWYKYVGLDGLAIGIDKFGASAPANKVIEEYGFTVEAVVEKIKNEL
ncbi:transketolase [Gemella haemolysans]|uniref:Transketolase n=1 Tax=Gemella haemolysans ATCC 10379 TaxID=546270 RepID=C5NYK3_9BACL|nr:transketolase [Gemella haemolysans]EER67801.1 transketolase [Gemella haemolysans ATCC 10379]KAA8709349.1 transketolase [Gemella haemolysans]UBH83050.1 transketolase [Gemella haemolysans]VEI38680.1 Transketolase [Gemella haemolysans]